MLRDEEIFTPKVRSDFIPWSRRGYEHEPDHASDIVDVPAAEDCLLRDMTDEGTGLLLVNAFRLPKFCKVPPERNVRCRCEHGLCCSCFSVAFATAELRGGCMDGLIEATR